MLYVRAFLLCGKIEHPKPGVDNLLGVLSGVELPKIALGSPLKSTLQAYIVFERDADDADEYAYSLAWRAPDGREIMRAAPQPIPNAGDASLVIESEIVFITPHAEYGTYRLLLSIGKDAIAAAPFRLLPEEDSASRVH